VNKLECKSRYLPTRHEGAVLPQWSAALMH
jgi:hypothetical protein